MNERSYKFPIIFILFVLINTSALARFKVNEPAPTLLVKTLTGNEFDLEKQRGKGKITIVHFGATWCTSCQQEMKILNKLYQERHATGLEILAVFLDQKHDRDEVIKQVKAFSFPIAMAYDAKKNGFGAIGSLPLTYLIDGNGVVRDIFIDEKVLDETRLAEALALIAKAP